MVNSCTYFYFAILMVNSFRVSQSSGWGYAGPTGPSNWKKLPGASACLGHKQSPININTFESRYRTFPPFVMQGYDVATSGPTHPTSMLNNGHTVQMNLEGDYLLSGGGLPRTYKAVQFHLHWGSVNSKGSEHTKNGMPHPAEMHIVHYDSTTYNSISEAVSKPNGLAVLGFWIKLGAHNDAWDPVINHLATIRDVNTPYLFEKTFALSSLLPADLSRFYRYSGSLTTPPCYESVIWTLFDNEIVLSYGQFAQLRRVKIPDHHSLRAGPHHVEKIQDNYRPIQRLWFRKVFQSWPHDFYYYYESSNADVIAEANTGVTADVSTDGANVGASTGDTAGVSTGTRETGRHDQVVGRLSGRNRQAKPHSSNVDPPVLEDNGYGAYIGHGTGMEWLWQALMHGEYADNQDLEYYDFDYSDYGDDSEHYNQVTMDSHPNNNNNENLPHKGHHGTFNDLMVTHHPDHGQNNKNEHHTTHNDQLVVTPHPDHGQKNENEHHDTHNDQVVVTQYPDQGQKNENEPHGTHNGQVVVTQHPDQGQKIENQLVTHHPDYGQITENKPYDTHIN